MKEIILCKYGEIALKGLNKRWFEEILIRELEKRLARFGGFSVTSAQSTITIEPSDGADIGGAYEAVKKVFGIATVSRADAVEKDMGAILASAEANAARFLAGVSSFKVEAKRSDKRFPFNSPQIAAEVGGVLFDAAEKAGLKIRVDVNTPETVVRVEIRDKYAYICAGQEKGAGGMPHGTNGRGLLLLSGGIDSPVAGYMMAKRGVTIDALHFESFPYTGEKALEKVLELSRIMSAYCGVIRVNVVNAAKIQEEIRDRCDGEYSTLLLRRFMMRIAGRLAEKYGCGAVITGESLGQVASQTMQAIGVTDAAVSLPVFRPCIGMDKEEIIAVARHIGTFETSILPYEDCCTVFTPRHPKTRPELCKVLEQEALLDIEALENEAVETLTVKTAEPY